jgi:hypothetical protein
LAESRGHAKGMYRKVLGGTIPITKAGEKKKYYYLSIYGFKNNAFSDLDTEKLEDILQREAVNYFYSGSQYDETDFWGKSWIRETDSDTIDYDADKIGKWFFQVGGKSKSEGSL